MVHKEELKPHVVIPDTNVLWCKDKSFVVNPEFDEFWNNFVTNTNLELVIPEVVRGELLFQQSTSAKKHLEKVNDGFAEISSITNYKYKHRITENRTKNQIELRFDKWVKGKKGSIEASPIKNIDWNIIIDSAIWRKPPFEAGTKNPDAEKGFRDAIILETIIEYCRHDESKKQIAFLCNDRLLRTTAENRLKQDDRFSVFESLGDFESYLKLQHEQKEDKFIKALLRKASEKFFKEGDLKSVAFSGKLMELINNKYAAFLEDPKLTEGTGGLLGILSSQPVWEPIADGKYWVASTQFNKIEDSNIYHWITEVTYVRPFYKKKRSIRDLAPVGIGSIDEKLLLLPFQVGWVAKVTRNGRFRESSIVNVDLNDNEFVILTDDLEKRWELNGS